MPLKNFFASGSPASIALQTVHEKLIQRGWAVGVFGGAARDILLRGPEASPRDIDIVVDCQSRLDLKQVLKPFAPTMNGFSGLSFKIGEVPFDVWRLKDTWAFDGLGIREPVLADLLKTTFFNIEQVVIEMPRGIVHDGGFRRAFQDRVLELNLADNPYPALCLIRIVVFAQKFGMRLGPRLEDWILQHHKEPKDGLVERIQQKYYGRQVMTPEALREALELACDAARARHRATQP